jgi:hypothetical protein
MVLKANDAQSLIIQEWRRWSAKNPEARQSLDGGALAFFRYLEKEKPAFLDFRCFGDKWQRVQTWLLVQDALKTKTM